MLIFRGVKGENCMEDQRKNELAVIIAETVAFGVLSRLLVRTSIYGLLETFQAAFLYQLYYGGFITPFYFVSQSRCVWIEEIRST